ncbi:MAG: helix-turn-helix transcriptional regulator [Acidobacteria bacterium]|nr:helix-turn-helix transcriptional regulator [Acidobacteriota bacterium]
MSQERLALDAGFERAYISLIERGLKSPTVRAVIRLAEVLNIPPSEMMRRMEVLLAGPKKRPETPPTA